MAEGIIKRKTDKGFGFIETSSGTDIFFHSSAVQGTTFDELRERHEQTLGFLELPLLAQEIRVALVVARDVGIRELLRELSIALGLLAELGDDQV